MNDDEIMEKARQSAVLARKAIAEAGRALERSQNYFQSIGVDPEKLISQFEREAGIHARLEVEKMVELAMEDVKREADNAVREARQATVVTPMRKKIRQHI